MTMGAIICARIAVLNVCSWPKADVVTPSALLLIQTGQRTDARGEVTPLQRSKSCWPPGWDGPKICARMIRAAHIGASSNPHHLTGLSDNLVAAARKWPEAISVMMVCSPEPIPC